MLNSAPNHRYPVQTVNCGVDSILCENMEEHKASYTFPLQEVERPSDWSKVLQK